MTTSLFPVMRLILLTGLIGGCAHDQAQAPSTVETPAPSDGTTGPQSPVPSELIGVTWQWTGFTTPVETIKVDAPERYTIRFEAGGRLAVLADCNRGSAGVSAGAGNFALGPMALTRAMCPPDSLSDRFVQELGRASSYFLKDGELFLELPVDSGTLRFHAASVSSK